MAVGVRVVFSAEPVSSSAAVGRVVLSAPVVAFVDDGDDDNDDDDDDGDRVRIRVQVRVRVRVWVWVWARVKVWELGV